MGSDKPDRDGFLAMIHAKIAALTALAESYRAAVQIGALGQGGDVDASQFSAPSSSTGNLSDVPAGAFLGKSMPDAIRLFLSIIKRKQTSQQVAAALREGGFESTSKNFEKTVNSTMHRMREAGQLLWFKDAGFGLAELYHESLRNRITRESKPVKKKAKPKKAKHDVSASLDERARAVVEKAGEAGASTSAISHELGEPEYLGMALARLARYGKIIKGEDGSYRTK